MISSLIQHLLQQVRVVKCGCVYHTQTVYIGYWRLIIHRHHWMNSGRGCQCKYQHSKALPWCLMHWNAEVGIAMYCLKPKLNLWLKGKILELRNSLPSHHPQSNELANSNLHRSQDPNLME